MLTPPNGQLPSETILALTLFQKAVQHNDTQKIRALSSAILSNGSLTPSLRIKVMVLIGNQLGMLGMADDASAMLEKALILAFVAECPADLTIAAGMSTMLAFQAMGDNEKALKILQRLRDTVGRSQALSLRVGHLNGERHGGSF